MKLNNVIDGLIPRMLSILEDVSSAKELVDDGKEVLCSRKLQGVQTKTNALVRDLVVTKKSIDKNNEDQ